ncbi:hypothetical protein [Desulfovibrio falkowii]|uniref:hypothetical protein n=1 Tax=Desulfovibrio sp. WGS1351 TaxID=3366814 RepID=UPI00372D3F13
MSILDGVKETLTLAKDAQTLPVLRERLALVQEQLAIAEKNLAALASENADLLRENREIRKKLDASQREAEYLDLGMCVLKVNPAGGYFETPLCPSCKKPLSKFLGGSLVCGSCSINLDLVAVNAAVKKALAS